MDLRERLDRELAEPRLPAPDLTDTLVAGRRAVRRRRVAGGVAGLATATALAGIAWSLAPAGEPDPRPERPSSSPSLPVDDDRANDCHEVPAAQLDACRGPVAGSGTGSISISFVADRGPVRRDPGVRVLDTIADPIGSEGFDAAYEVDDNGLRMMVLVGSRGGASEEAGEWAGDLAGWVEQAKDDVEVVGEAAGASGTPAHYNAQGVLVVAEDARIVEQVPNPLGLQDDATSVGLAVEHAGRTTWLLLSHRAGSQDAASVPAQQSFATLREWLDDMVAAQLGREPRRFVELDRDGTLRPLPGVRIVEQRAGVDLGSFPPGSTVVARLLVAGETWFVAACWCDGRAEYLPVNTPAAGRTLDAYIAYHRARNASGEGVR